MALVIVSHKVQDYDTWRPFFDADKDRRASAGISNERVLRPASDPNNVHIMWDIADPAILEPMLSDPGLQQVMQQAGVISQPTMQIFDEV